MNNSNRRGFLAFLGIGTVGGPAFVKETLAQGPSARVQSLAKGLAGSKLAENTGADPWDGPKASQQIKQGTKEKFSYKFFQKLKQRAKHKARLEFIKRNGLSPHEIDTAESDARQYLVKLGFPPHIRYLQSFSDSRKYQLSYDYYLEKALRFQVLRDEYSVAASDYSQRLRKYLNLFTKPLDRQQYGSKNVDDDDGDNDGDHTGPEDPDWV